MGICGERNSLAFISHTIYCFQTMDYSGKGPGGVRIEKVTVSQKSRHDHDGCHHSPRTSISISSFGINIGAQHSKGIDVDAPPMSLQMSLCRCPSCSKIDFGHVSGKSISRRSQHNTSSFNLSSRLYLTPGIFCPHWHMTCRTPLMIPASSGPNSASKALQNLVTSVFVETVRVPF